MKTTSEMAPLLIALVNSATVETHANDDVGVQAPQTPCAKTRMSITNGRAIKSKPKCVGSIVRTQKAPPDGVSRFGAAALLL